MNSIQQVPVASGSWFQQRTTLYAIGGILLGLLFPLVASFAKVAELALPPTVRNLFAMQSADRLLWIIDTAPVFLGILAAVAGRREDLHLQANALLRDRESELNGIRHNLEAAVAERTAQLDARNAQLRSVVTFARQVADMQDVATLLAASVRMISERFERSDVDLFLVDEGAQFAVLRASSSPAASEQLKNGHRVAVSDQTTVGRVARRGTMAVTPVRADGAGETLQPPAAEITLPLSVRGRVIGVLDVHSKGPQAGSQSEAELLQLIADQLAASIENARLVSEARAAVQGFESISGQTTRDAWQQFLRKNSIAYQLTTAGVRPAPSFSGNGSSGGLRLPLRLRGQEIGTIAVKRSSDRPWTESECDLMEKLAAQVALAVENARLIEETRQRAAQEQVISEVSARFSRSLDVETLLQAAVREFAALPEVAEATVVLKPSADDGSQRQN